MSENLVLDRLPEDCRLAAKCLEETGTFEIGQSLFCEAADEITRLRAALADAQAVGFAAGVVASAKRCDAIAGNTADFNQYHRRAAGQCGAAIRALTPPDATAAAARVLLGDDIQIARMAEAIHDGPLGADAYWFSAATKQGAWCVDMVRTALRAIAGDTP